MTDIVDRRAFLKRSAVTAGGAVVATSALQRLTEHAAMAAPNDVRGRRGDRGRDRRRQVEQSPGYGRLERMADQHGVEVLALPVGFSYVTRSPTGGCITIDFDTARKESVREFASIAGTQTPSATSRWEQGWRWNG
ncbi:MAG TPA: twin-arginine translocation signal domain-containing protein [Acidimicrobiales bacterium]|nr:twin-arginine translocation signal domain-containing protein [Acidimicrobiales bacterium]